MTSFSLTFSVFKAGFTTLQAILDQWLGKNDLVKRVQHTVLDAEEHLRYVRDQERNEAEDLHHL